jgi:putative tricarboxylic transport membrane protein
MMEMSFRQSLSMSSGSYSIFVTRPIALGLLTVALAVLLSSIIAFVMRKADWRQRLGLAAAKE